MSSASAFCPTAGASGQQSLIYVIGVCSTGHLLEALPVAGLLLTSFPYVSGVQSQTLAQQRA